MGGWADLPAELLAIISNSLQEESTYIHRFRGVCRSWRSSVTPTINNHIISPLFPRCLSSTSWSLLEYCYGSLTANAVYHLRSINLSSANWIVSVQESCPGKLLLRHALSLEPIPGPSGFRTDNSEWTLTRISTSHSFTPLRSFTPLKSYWHPCSRISKTKVVFVNDGGDSEPMAVFKNSGLCALRRGQLVSLHGVLYKYFDFVNHNGCLYVVDSRADVYVLDCTRLQLLRLTCVNLCDCDSRCASSERNRFVVSDGGLYLLFSFCMEMTGRHEILVYKLMMDDDINATSYRMEKVENLGERVFFVNKDCSFSVSA